MGPFFGQRRIFLKISEGPYPFRSEGRARSRGNPFTYFVSGALLGALLLSLVPCSSFADRGRTVIIHPRRSSQVDEDVEKILMRARLAMRDLAECNREKLADLNRVISRCTMDLARYEVLVAGMLHGMAMQLFNIMKEMEGLLPEGPSPAKEILKQGLNLASLIPGPAGAAATIASGGIGLVEWWASAREAAHAAGVSRDILQEAGEQVIALDEALHLSKDIDKALREMREHQGEIQKLLDTYKERCGRRELVDQGPPPGQASGEAWREVAKNVVETGTGTPLDGATVTLIPREDKDRPITPVEEGTPEPGDTVVVTAPCHLEQRFVVGIDPPPDKMALEKKPLRAVVIGGDTSTKAGRKEICEAVPLDWTDAELERCQDIDAEGFYTGDIIIWHGARRRVAPDYKTPSPPSTDRVVSLFPHLPGGVHPNVPLGSEGEPIEVPVGEIVVPLMLQGPLSRCGTLVPPWFTPGTPSGPPGTPPAPPWTPLSPPWEPGTVVIEFDLPRHGQPALQGPNDPLFRSKGSWGQDYDDQWGLKRIGFDIVDPRKSVWPEKGEPVIVAVVDTGVDRFHPDLLGATWINKKEIPGNGKDDDGNGYVDDVYGWNFVHKNNDVRDENGHGTVVAGIIAAGLNDGIGVAGVNPWAIIMPVKATNLDNSGGSIDLADAVMYAANNGARVINVSVGGKGLSRYEQIAVMHARKKGAVVVVASGNEGVNTAEFSPAGLNGVVTVASTDMNDKRLAFSNWGQRIDVAAPGADILSLRARGTDLLRFESKDYRRGTAFVGKEKLYYRVTGSSFSAPFVSGVASLLMSVRPDLTAEQVIRMILHSARDIDMPGWDQFTGYGLLDARAALGADPDFFVEARITGVGTAQSGGRQVLRVSGTADADRFRRAWIEIGKGQDPREWQNVSGEIKARVRQGALADLPIDPFRTAPQWTLRLIAEHENGRTREARFFLKLK